MFQRKEKCNFCVSEIQKKYKTETYCSASKANDVTREILKSIRVTEKCLFESDPFLTQHICDLWCD